MESSIEMPRLAKTPRAAEFMRLRCKRGELKVNVANEKRTGADNASERNSMLDGTMSTLQKHYVRLVRCTL